MKRKMKIGNFLYEWNVVMRLWMKLDCVNKLNNISWRTFCFRLKNTFFTEHLRAAASGRKVNIKKLFVRTEILFSKI